MKPKTKTEQILTVMPILAWVAFVAFMIEAGAILFSYFVSYDSPEAARDLYRGLNLYNLRQLNFWYYTMSISFIVALSLMKSFVSFLVIRTLSKFNLKNPFSEEVASKLEKISYFAFGTWVITMLSNAHTGWLLKITGELHGNWISGEFIFMVGLVFIIAQVFKRGVEIQSENELTV
jgi:hypothetical protein|uniref:DUF2975 domain-containing protein n=1 Tax=Fulvivirga sp. TaxID=1931237 RepID=UPI0040498638